MLLCIAWQAHDNAHVCNHLQTFIPLYTPVTIQLITKQTEKEKIKKKGEEEEERGREEEEEGETDRQTDREQKKKKKKRNKEADNLFKLWLCNLSESVLT